MGWLFQKLMEAAFAFTSSAGKKCEAKYQSLKLFCKLTRQSNDLLIVWAGECEGLVSIQHGDVFEIVRAVTRQLLLYV